MHPPGTSGTRRLHFADGIGKELAQPGLFPGYIFAFRDMETVDLIVRDKGPDPVTGFVRSADYFAGSFRNDL
jgi:hypothetical protein